MSLRFIIGRAGTGKTSYILDNIHKELRQRPRGPGIIVLVPDQATFQMERVLASLPDLGGAIRAHVYSFRRLAWRVLQEAGGAARPHLRETGKRMVICNLLQQRKDELRVFGRAANQPDFADSLARLIGEMKIYCITPEELARKAAAGDTGQVLLQSKLQDISLLYSDFQQFLENTFIDPDDYLNLLAERLSESPTCQGAEVWVDGFTGFTPQEYRVLQNLMLVSARVNVALCCEPAVLKQPLDEQELFHGTHQTFDILTRLAETNGVEIEKPCLLDGDYQGRFHSRPALGHLEKHLVSSCKPYVGEANGLKLVAAHSRQAEVEGAAREIIALARDESYRWREITVLVRDITQYGEMVERVFAEYDIPCFIDYKRPVLHHPLVELLRAAMETVISRWSYAAVFRYLKTDLVPVSREEVDLLENYVLAHGIRGSRWTDGQPWRYRRVYSAGKDNDISDEELEELEKINEIRHRAVKALVSFAAAAGEKTATVLEVSAALYTLMKELGIREKLEEWSRLAQERGQLDRAREHAQIYNQILLLLDEMVEAMGELELTAEEYLQVLETGLNNLRLGLIPPGLDQVLVGSLDRSRSPQVRASLLLGVNEGVLPARPSTSGLFTDRERETLLSDGLKIAPGERRSLFDEQYLIYLGLTRAGEYLWISYALADEEGNGLLPSRIIADIKKLFPRLAETVLPLEPDGGEDDLHFVARPRQALSCLAARLREARAGSGLSSPWTDAYNWLAVQDKDRLRQVLAGLFYQNYEDPLPINTCSSLYEDFSRVSVTRIEQYVYCPFAHFLRYGLRLQERETWQMRPADLGQFFHTALKMFVEAVDKAGINWAELSDGQCQEIIDRIFEVLLPQLGNEMLMSSQRQQYFTAKLRRVVQTTVKALVEHTRAGDFRPLQVEVGFGYRGGELQGPSLRLSDGSVIKMMGRIDRIDIAHSGYEAYLRVIDYKSGSTDFDLGETYHGLKLQLLAYLDVVMENAHRLAGKKARPGGIYYSGIKQPLIYTKGPAAPEHINQEMRKKFKLSGLTLAEEKVIELSDRGLTGNSEIIPVGLKKDGGFRAHSRIATREQLERLRQRFYEVLEEAVISIRAGEVGIEPYQLGNRSGCTYCRFKPVCQFDPMVGNRYRVLKPLKPKEVWQLLGEGEGE